MKKLAGILLIFTTILSCKNNDQFTVDGKFSNAGDLKQVYLYKQDKILDSALLNEDKEFKFHVASPNADFFYIVAKDKNYLLAGKNGDHIRFEADYSSQAGDYSIEGSELAGKLKEFNQLSNKYGRIFMDLQQQYEQTISKDPSLKDSLEAVLIPRFEQNMKAFSDASIAFANKNKDNLAGFYAISSLDATRYEPQLLAYAADLKGKFPDNKAVQDFLAKMEKVKAVAIGQTAPEFQAPSLDGKNVKLSDFRGKYVLLDFWASWCAPCREENPNLVKQYNAYKDKNFTVLGFSLDNSKSAWEKAVQDDKLAWTHVSELKQWDSDVAKQYQVEAIPASFLLDPQGKIVAKNLRGKELEEFLKKTLQ